MKTRVKQPLINTTLCNYLTNMFRQNAVLSVKIQIIGLINISFSVSVFDVIRLQLAEVN